MAATQSSAFSAAVQFKIQSAVLKNLRAELVWANDRYAEKGSFAEATDQIAFVKYPDLSITVPLTPLTEGSAPTARALTMSIVTIQTAEYGDLVGLTNIAKIKGPNDVVSIATERVSRTAKEVIDRVTRDAIFLGGTAYYPMGSTNTARSDIASTEYATGADLIKLRSTMRKNKVPMTSDGKYWLLAGPNVVYDLKADTTTATSWLDISKYSNPSDIMDGEIGTLHGFRIVEVNNAPTFSSTTTVYASLALGSMKGWGAGELETLKTYHVAPGGDHSDPLAQIEYVGWRVNFGVGVLNNGYYYRPEFAAHTL